MKNLINSKGEWTKLKQNEKITSKELVRKMTEEYYDNLMKAKERGKIVAWATSVVPQEFMEAMDIEVAFPENHAAALASKGGTLELLEYAESIGYASDICSYARTNMAYAHKLESNILNLPKPDFVVSTSNICNTVIKWYENLAKIFDVPFILIDTPYNVEEEISENTVEYIKGQFFEFIKQLEVICNKPFNYSKFNDVMKISMQSAASWMKAMEYTMCVPSPLDGYNMFNYMALIVCTRGKKEASQLFDLIAEEMEEMIKTGQSQFKTEEKFRYLWEGIACFPYLSYCYKTMKNNGSIMVTSTYPRTWHIDYEMNNIDSMARAYSKIPMNCCLKEQIQIRTDLVRNYNCDGVLYHINRSCKVMDFMQHNLIKGIYENTKVPTVNFDGDQADPRNFAKAQYDTRTQALVESMESIKEERGDVK